MRALVYPSLVVASLLIPGLSQASEPMKAIVGSYLQIQTALAADKTEGVSAAAASIGAQAAKMADKGTAIGKAAKVMADSADIKAARQAFGDLSDAVIAAARAEGWDGLPEAKVAYCPMVKKSWVQTGDQIRNPYYGSKMLTCGEFQKR